MKPAHLLAALFVLLTVLADALVYRLSPAGGEMIAFVAGLSFGQVGLATAWFVFGRRSLWLRLLLLAVTAFLTGLLLVPFSENDSFEWLGFLALYVGAESAGLLGLRLSGLRVVDSVHDRDGDADHGVRQWQFSLNGMLLTTTLVCLMSAAVRWIKPADWLVVLLYCFGFVPITLLSLWAAWSRRSWVLRTAIALPLVIVLGLLLGLIEGPRGIDWLLISIACLQSGYVSAGSLVARVGGLRLHWVTAS